ncbi:sulfatase [Halobaculum sp. MBLA0143]|uniref:sulfatase n=1 Tax=Halobaculum sp. MBLA0143 TaxID=3079933 RepID=UPI00352558F0
MTDYNVLLVIADSLRAANTSALGYRRETTPFLSAFASEATVYTQARAPSNWTVPSHVSMFTGHDAAAHEFEITDRFRLGHTIWEELAERGYDTGLFSDNPFLTAHESGLDRPFQTAEGTPESWDETYDTGGSLGDWPNGFYYADRLLEWADGRDRWAACLNLMDTHRPYEPRAAYDEWSDDRVRALQEEMGYKWHWEFLAGEVSLGFASLLEAIYDGGVRQADAIFEQLLAGLDDAGTLEDTLVVFTSDHGEGLGEATALESEPPAVSHRLGTHDNLFHVPLVVRAPGQRRGRRVDDLATLTAFPDAVRALALGEAPVDGGAFVADDGVALASQRPITAAMREEAERICGSATPYARRADVVYEDRPGDAVVKRARWGPDGYETLRRGRREATDRGEIDGDRVVAARDDHRGSSVTLGEPLDEITEFADASDNEFAEGLDERLDALGYR